MFSTDPAMDTFVDWDDGTSKASELPMPPMSGARKAASLNAGLPISPPFPAACHLRPGRRTGTNSGGRLNALDCPTFGGSDRNNCPGDVTASSDLSHFVFATEWSRSRLAASSSAPVPSTTTTRTLTRSRSASKSSRRRADPQPSLGDQAGDPLQIPAVSATDPTS